MDTLHIVRHRLLRTFQRVSYAQEGEDLILRRVFEDQRKGFYIDVGAHHPQRFSNTCLFYQAGWSGINIDAAPGSMRLFQRLRPRDTNLELAVGEPAPPKTFYVFNEPALNTFDPKHVKEYQSSGYRVVAQISVPVRALRDILDEHLAPGRRIDFLSIDVEGLDLEVLQSNDWHRFRPTCILVETLHQDTMAATASPTGQFLRDQGYVLFAKTPNTSFFKQQ